MTTFFLKHFSLDLIFPITLLFVAIFSGYCVYFKWDETVDFIRKNLSHDGKVDWNKNTFNVFKKEIPMLNTIISLKMNFQRLFWGLPYKSQNKSKNLESSTNILTETAKLNASLLRQFWLLPDKSREERKKVNEKKGKDAFDMLANISGVK